VDGVSGGASEQRGDQVLELVAVLFGILAKVASAVLVRRRSWARIAP
jgi:hypothetical protein